MMNLWFYLLGVNALTYFLYWQDKRAARRGGWRVAEATLLMAGLFGGSPAAFVAQRRLRHKNRKQSFQFAFWMLVVVQVALLLFPPYLLRVAFAKLFHT